ncbi:hypothetical protein N9B73_12115 [Verrucomicrobiales bacterium]|nr:hypothetical protein [Verrucomicrobiales bacterium]
MRFPRIPIDRSGAHLIPLPSILAFSDIAATLYFQPKAYWEGVPDSALDANPLVRIALNISPLLSIPAAAAWFALICLTMLTLPPLWRQRFYLFLCIAHLIFVWGWIIRWNFVHGITFTLLAAVIAVIMRRQITSDKRRIPPP